jgi:O-acetyl-ADP-ribose deacetylase (regulator of RNase III)
MSQLVREHTFSSGHLLQLAQGDITQERVDAIVNAANAYLSHGAGVAGAIVRKGGPIIQAESDQWVREHGPVSHAEPAYTQGGELTCRYVIHAVGPRWGEGGEPAKLKEAVSGTLSLADKLGLASMALPAISTGIFGFPKALAAHVILDTIREYFVQNSASNLEVIRLVLFDQATLLAFIKVWEQDDHLCS